MRISKIIVEILCMGISYVFFNFDSNSYVSYCLSDKYVKISKIILEIEFLCLILFKSNSYASYCFSDQQVIKNFKAQNALIVFHLNTNITCLLTDLLNLILMV